MVADADDRLVADLQDLLASNGPLMIGADRTRGLGRVSLSFSKAIASQPEEIGERIQRFNDHLRAVRGDTAGSASEAMPTYIPLTLSSDAVLLDADLIPVAHPTRPILERYHRLGNFEGSVPGALATEPVVVLQSTHTVGGWDGVRGVPRLRYVAFTSGSVWVYALAGTLDTATLQWLAVLEREGLGELRAEGYGALIVAHPLHLQQGEVWDD
jgi:hypothetical protein